jgi:hypothetical protein
LATTASAQSGDAELQRKFESAFQDMLQDPANLDKTFYYAELAIRVGDYEAAISALERMLLYNPDLPRVRLELGVLYFRLGSFAIARTYLTRAVAGENVPDDVRARVAVFMDEIDKRLSNHRFAGSVYGGLRYQTNANAGPERPAISLLGLPAILGGQFTKKTDWNAFVSSNLRYSYDPQLHSGEVLETELLLYGSRQAHEKQLDLLFAEITVGPRGQFLREYVDSASWRPYLVGSHVVLDKSPYFNTYGAGVSLDKQFTAATNGELEVSAVRKKYRADVGRPTARNQDSYEREVEANVRHQIADNVMLTGTAGVTSLSADVSLHSNVEFKFGIGGMVSHPAPFELTARPWTTALNGSYLYSRYHAPDPAVDPARKRADREHRVSLLTSVPITRDVSITGTLQRTVVNSTFLNFTYNNWTASLGAALSF